MRVKYQLIIYAYKHNSSIFNFLFNSILNVLKHRWRMCYVTPWWVQGPSYFWIAPWLVLQLSLGIFLRSDTNWGDVRKKLQQEFGCTRTNLSQHRIYVSPLHNLVCVWVCVWHLLCLAVLWRRKGHPGIETASLLMPTEEPDILRSVDTTDALKSNPEPLIGT